MSPGGVLPEVVGDQLVLFYLGQTHGYDEEGQSANPRLEVMELDGSGRRETLSFSPNQMVEKPMLTDGENIYARLTTYQADETKAELIGINPTQGTYKVVCSLDANQNERIWGCAGSYLILYRTQQEGAGLELCKLNLQTTECETIYQWNETQALGPVWRYTGLSESNGSQLPSAECSFYGGCGITAICPARAGF